MFFNRDERHDRVEALVPKQYQWEGTKVLSPLDPLGQGSWIAANEWGLAICLLNHYPAQKKEPPAILHSRGSIVKSLAAKTSIAHIQNWFNQVELSVFAPFHLCAISLDQGNSQWTWDGVQLLQEKLDSNRGVKSSSSFKSDVVVPLRTTLFDEYESQEDYHCSHKPDKGALSVCVHRPDVGTVSLTAVEISPTAIQMRYKPGAPCCAQWGETLALPVATRGCM